MGIYIKKYISFDPCFVRLIIALCLVVILQGCHTAQSVQSGTKNKTQQVFDSRNPRIVSHFGDLELEVMMATAVDLPKDDYKDFLDNVPEFVAYTWIDVETPPAAGGGMSSASFSASMAFLITAACFHEKGIWDSVTEAFINYEFTRAINKAIEDRLIITFAKERPPNVTIDVTIKSFGLAGRSLNMACVTVSADFILSRGGMEVSRDHIKISEFNSSKDAPPPQCAHLKRFAENNARLIKDTLAEYAEVLAVMVIDRIPKGNSK
jgi:hypothetical protein